MTAAPVWPSLDARQPSDFPGLHNVVAYAPGLYSGSAPEDDQAFAALTEMGIKTIISVDGALPDVDRARVHGLRYVHLPIGYNGMDKGRTLEIARAVRDLPGPVYLHCHHGMHRSAGAAGAAAVTLGFLTPAQATAKLKISGTSPSYIGLYQCVAVAAIASMDELNAAPADFPEVWRTTGLVKTMVEVDETFDHLKLIENAGWKTPVDHPDLVPAAEAGRLADLLRNLKDDEHVQAKPAEFTQTLLDATMLASSIETDLLRSTPDAAGLSGLLHQMNTSCKGCHARWRD